MGWFDEVEQLVRECKGTLISRLAESSQVEGGGVVKGQGRPRVDSATKLQDQVSEAYTRSEEEVIHMDKSLSHSESRGSDMRKNQLRL